MKIGAEERLRRCSRPSALRTLFVNSPASRRRPQQYPAKKVEMQEHLHFFDTLRPQLRPFCISLPLRFTIQSHVTGGNVL